MYVFGITGGVGAGKSTVLRLLQEHFQAFVIMADDVGRAVMEPGQKGYNQILDVFGENVVSADGTLDREKLAAIIFHASNKRLALNSIVHPLVKKQITEDIAQLRIEGRYDYVFVEAALLIEDHYDVLCDELWYIYCDTEVRRQRLRHNRGYSDAKITQMMDSQLSDAQFREHCSRVIDNSSDETETLKQLKEIMREYGELREN